MPSGAGGTTEAILPGGRQTSALPAFKFKMSQRSIQEVNESVFPAGKTGGVPLRQEPAAAPGSRAHAGGINPKKMGWARIEPTHVSASWWAVRESNAEPTDKEPRQSIFNI